MCMPAHHIWIRSLCHWPPGGFNYYSRGLGDPCEPWFEIVTRRRIPSATCRLIFHWLDWMLQNFPKEASKCIKQFSTGNFHQNHHWEKREFQSQNAILSWNILQESWEISSNLLNMLKNLFLPAVVRQATCASTVGNSGPRSFPKRKTSFRGKK